MGKGRPSPRALWKAVAYGMVSILLYAGLYAWEGHILRWTTQGGWYFILPVLTAFLFSFVHGGFTGYFWESLGVQAKPGGEKKPAN